MDNQDLGRYQDMMPSRAMLARLLKALPPMSTDERRRYYDEIWKLASLPSEEDMLKSPVGKATLELLRNSKPVGDDVAKRDTTDVKSPEPPAMEAQVTNASPPVIEDDGINDHLKQLNWPPKPTPQPKAVEDDGIQHKWQAARPSAPDTSLKPLASDDFASNQPIY